MIQIENVSFQYNNSEKGALKDISISVDKGECVLLCGASGCGKTTITRLINGLIPHFYEGEYSGNVSVYGMNVQSEELYNISKRWVVYFRIQEVSFSAWIQQVKLRLDAKIWDL